MIININEKYFIEKDDYCYTLKEHTGKYDKKGKETPKIHGHFTNLSGLLRHLSVLTTQEKLGEVANLTEYIVELKRQNDKLANLLKEVGE